MPSNSDPPRAALREALLAFAATTLACAILWRLREPLGGLLHIAIAVVFLLVPRWLLDRRGADWAAYGLTWRPLGRGLALVSVAALIVYPPFLAGFVAYYDRVCAMGLLRRMCAGWLGWGGASLRLAPDFATQVVAQVAAVALPEEFFYRGWLQGRLADAWPDRRRFLGAPVGAALLAQSAAFGVAHFLVDGDPRRLATFFPALVFGWMRARTGSILAPTLFHALCNLYIDALHTSFFR